MSDGWFDDEEWGDPDDDLPYPGQQSQQSMGRRAMKSGEEQDVHTGWRRLMVGMNRAGVTDRVKRRTRRRERREAKREMT